MHVQIEAGSSSIPFYNILYRRRSITPYVDNSVEKLCLKGYEPGDSRKRLVRALEEYQLECFGESRITVEVLDFVNNAFRRDKGVVLTNKKDDIDLREMAPPKRVSKPKRTSEPKGGTQKTAGSSPGTDTDNKLFENAV